MDVFFRNKKAVTIAAIVLLVAVSMIAYIVKQSTGESFLLQSEMDSEIGTEEDSETIPEPHTEAEVTLVVDVAGEVNLPSVYVFSEGARVYEAIDAAGGLTESADTRNTNLAAHLIDGTKLFIPSTKEVENEIIKAGEASGSGFAGDYTYSVKKDKPSSKSGLININTADSNELQRLTGVGPATSEKIIAYRGEYGKFSKIEDLMNVSGIGEKTFEKLRNFIIVE